MPLRPLGLKFLEWARLWLAGPADNSMTMPVSARQSFLNVRQHFIAAALLSGGLNVLMLSGSIFMLQVYDRVLPSHSVPTLQALCILIIGIYALVGILESVRSRIFSRIGFYVDLSLSDAVFDFNLYESTGARRDTNLLRDLDHVRNFLAGGGPSALFDLPWMPLYTLLLFLLHPWLGLFGLTGLIILAMLTWRTERSTAPLQMAATRQNSEAYQLSDMARLSAETLRPLGMGEAVKRQWRSRKSEAGDLLIKSSDVSSLYSAASRFTRMGLQSLVLALGAFLVIKGEATGGVMIASSILLGRALSPMEMAIGQWKNFVVARQAYNRLSETLLQQAPTPGIRLPWPKSALEATGVCVAAADSSRLILQNITFRVEAGDALGILGPSGSGKTTLVRTIVGTVMAARGKVQFDGSTLDQWAAQDIGNFIGYLPQAVELFPGTIGENIARFTPDAPSEAVLKAARDADVDRLIRGLDKGFETPVGPGGSRLSAGQRQRVALARALYGDPFLVILDEASSALDGQGEAALIKAIGDVRKRGGIALVVAHRPALLQYVNKVLVLSEGQQINFGLRDDIFKRNVESVPTKPGLAV